MTLKKSFISECLKVIRYAGIMEEYGTGLMKETSISQTMQNLSISYMQENKEVIL